MEIFEQNECYPLLIAQPQQGKTNAQIATADAFREKCKQTNKTYEIIVLTNLSANELKDQTEDRFGKAGFINGEDTRILHHNDISSLKLKEVDQRLIMIDECHYALGKDKVFHEFCKKNGIYYGNPINTWINKNTYVLSISATPYASKIREDLDNLKQNPSFKTVVLEVSPKYFSLMEIRNKQRLLEANDIIVDNCVSEWFKNTVLNKYFEDCGKSNGYLVVRLTGEKVEILQKYLLGEGIKSEVFDNKKKNISKFDQRLNHPITDNKPKILIIKNSYRAGKTLTNTKMIRGWVESKSSDSDVVAQVVGRCCGYEVDGHSKFNDEFPFYCNIKKIDVAIDFYKDNAMIPSSHNNKSNFEIKDYEWCFITESEGRIIGKTEGVGTISGNNAIDIAKNILTGSKPSGKQEVYKIDSFNINYLDSWNNLINKYNNIVGKCVYYKNIEPALINKNSEEALLKNKVLFSNNDVI